MKYGIFESGEFSCGCNYWASHAGTAMWHDWNEQAVADDMAAMAQYGMTTLRVFPLWPDFQPLHRMYGCAGAPRELRKGEKALSGGADDRDGIDPAMLERFATLADLAAAHGMKLIVGLITGWMSGRLFVPPALEGRDILTDPESIMLQVRFVRRFVREFRDHQAVAAWDLGNECNCLEREMTAPQAWLWLHSIASAIRLEDSSRPVVSGMHALQVSPEATWNMDHHGELIDVMTTHPYPLFTPDCNKGPLNELPGTLHAAAESCLYADLTGRPCFPEEAGSLGPMVASGERTAAAMRSVLFSSWAHNLRAMLWWCAFDQEELVHPPYDWIALERELGLFTSDRHPKQTAVEMKKFTGRIAALPFSTLPGRAIDATVLLTRNQDHWRTAFGSFLLAKQAGFEIRFDSAEHPLNDSSFYILPSISGAEVLTRARYHELLERVKAGATLLVTSNGGMLQPFEEVFGCRIDYRCTRPEQVVFDFESSRIQVAASVTQRLIVEQGEVVVRDLRGHAVLTRFRYGQGMVLFCTVPLELHAADMTCELFKLYRYAAKASGSSMLFADKSPALGVTSHAFGDGREAVVCINYSSEDVRLNLTGFSVDFADAPMEDHAILIPGNDARILTGRRC